MAQGRRPDPFRTRKLRPGTAMVLHLEGCGRVARRRTQTSKGRGHHNVPPPFSHTRTQPHTRPGSTQTRAWNKRAKPGQPPRHTPSMNRQRPHHTYDRHGIREPKIIALGVPFLRVCGGIHNPGGRHRGTIPSPGAPPARSCPGIHNHALPAHRASRAPASGIRRMPRHTRDRQPPDHTASPVAPRGRQGHGKHARCHDTPTATTPAGITSKPPVPICHRHTPNKPATPDHPSA